MFRSSCIGIRRAIRPWGLRQFHNTSRWSESEKGVVDGSKLLAKLDMLGLSSKPANNIESVLENGIQLSNGIVIKSPGKDKEIVGALLLGSEAFELNLSGKDNQQPIFNIINNFLVEFSNESLNIFKLVHPKPELVVVGLGKKSRILHESNRKFFNSLGIQIEIGNTRNACQSFDLLATERPNQIAALILPPNI
ncbi:hypothetical protein DASC09_029220 [Saccharomycopsis crataegensis]|uniref:NADH dehydrogenase [ubiquinone] 1 alpha subcomplex assembly factor 3 n=1 Tax=Saccharomycopsis crataegensis TaxID=43959 RepID=A0AAV5QLV1_9ASCO|nr:hypothetical protein DASC09_029220 [Saccharomycopsis crataegensis]